MLIVTDYIGENALRQGARHRRFRYVAETFEGVRIQDTLQASSLRTAVAMLEHRRLLIIDIQPAARAFNLAPFLARRVGALNLIRMTRCLATMFNAGLSVTRTLQCLVEQETDTVLKAALEDIDHRINSGQTFSQAFAAHPGVFSPIYVSMLKVGETTGGMYRVLQHLGDFLERDYRLMARAKTAMTYPIIVFVVSILITVGLFTWVLPPLLDTCTALAGPHALLPLPTRLLTFMLRLARNPFMQGFALFMVTGLALFFRQWRGTEAGRIESDRWLVTVPIVGDLVSKVMLARFCRAWGNLLSAGVSMFHSLELLGDFFDNAFFRQTVVKPLTRDLVNGVTLRTAIDSIEFFPNLVLAMLSAGEASGEVDGMLLRIADFLDTEVGYAMESLLTLIEPIMIAIMGCLVCFILLSVFLPLYQVVMEIGH